MNPKILEQVKALRDGGSPAAVVIISGSPGRGKSFTTRVIRRWARLRDTKLQKWIWIEVIRPYKMADHDNSLVHLFSSEAAYGEKADAAQKRLASLLACHLLIIDDLGNERNPPPTFEPGLASLFEQRWDANRPTWVITNLEPDEIKNRYGDRNFSRIWVAAKVVPFTGRDRRAA